MFKFSIYKVVLIGLILLGFFIIFYFSWIPQPRIGSTGFIPHWLAVWADEKNNDNLRTGVPFLFLGIVSGLWILVNHLAKKWWFIFWIFLVALVLVAESGQMFLEKRVFDWMDIIWGATGALTGLGIIFLIQISFKKL